jgi:hypothetical protein
MVSALEGLFNQLEAACRAPALIQARVVEYQCHRVVCPECGESTRAPVPEEVAGHFGPQLTALIT